MYSLHTILDIAVDLSGFCGILVEMWGGIRSLGF